MRVALGDNIEEITTSSSPCDQHAWRQELQHILRLAPRLRALTAPQRLTHSAAQRLASLGPLQHLASLETLGGPGQAEPVAGGHRFEYEQPHNPPPWAPRRLAPPSDAACVHHPLAPRP